MKAVTISQPWASLVAIGAKTIDTRPYATSYRGLLAIHAAKTYPSVDDPYYRALLIAAGMAVDALPCGKIIAVGRLAACERITPATCPCYPEYAFGIFTPGWYAWKIDDIRPLKRLPPFKGHRGVWECPLPPDAP